MSFVSALFHQSLKWEKVSLAALEALPRDFSGEACFKQRTPLCLLYSSSLAMGGATLSFRSSKEVFCSIEAEPT